MFNNCYSAIEGDSLFVFLAVLSTSVNIPLSTVLCCAFLIDGRGGAKSPRCISPEVKVVKRDSNVTPVVASPAVSNSNHLVVCHSDCLLFVLMISCRHVIC